ncbi:MAG: ATP-dependent exonuclease SbcCD, C subunit-like protein [Methylococcaceae bacterium]|nr:ATP-dependent exonuclease SbcCD, C subunit-like protein [Methylococcaceae bacterium]
MHNGQLEFSFVDDDALAGFRLHRFELLNWGTFDKHIWQIKPNGDNALLTGDIGSGKSTLIDALTTLLVPAQKITYNKAAGAEGKERNLLSYIRGHYKSEKDEEKLAARQVALRDNSKYSVLLGYFYNQGYDTKVTLAQVFWCKDDSNQAERFYVISSEELGIAEHFSQFGSDMLALKKRLKQSKHNELFDSFAQYAAEFRRRLGIENEQALELLYQTVSMKAVSNLTDFVRQQMLEEPEERVTAICKEFDNLNRAYQAVLKAKQQLALLQPLLADVEKHSQVQQAHHEKSRCRGALDAYFSFLKTNLLRQRGEQLEQLRDKHQQKLSRQKNAVTALQEQRDGLKRSIDDNGGRRLAELDAEEQRLQQSQESKKRHAQTYAKLCQQLQLTPATNGEDFHDNRLQAQRLQIDIEQQQATITEEIKYATIERDALNEQANQLNAELSSLRQRRSNIPLDNLKIRYQLCTSLGISEDELLFAGELLKVDETENVWEGAIERVLHNFALSLLVTDNHYAAIAKYVDHNHLKGRLVYFRARTLNERFETPAPDYLFHKLRIQTDSPFYDWLIQKISHDFNYVCANTLDDFHRLPKAITAQGQVKSSAERHEKDDRHALNDRSRFVLGWDNHAKIIILEQQLADIQHQGSDCLKKLKGFEARLKTLTQQRDQVRDLLNIDSFETIDWQIIVQKIDALQAEKQAIQQSSDVLAQLKNQLQDCIVQLRTQEEQQESLIREDSKFDTLLEANKRTLHNTVQTLQALAPEEQKFSFAKLKLMQDEALPQIKMSIDNCDKHQKEMRDWLQKKMDADNQKLRGLSERVITQMQRYKDEYSLESRDVDASLESAAEFSEMLTKLEKEDLPRHEQKFHSMLKEGTIQKIAMFRANLEKEQDNIKEKIAKINQSLNAINYNDNEGTFIILLAENSNDEEIRSFQQDLKACLTDALSEDDNLYDEHKFHQVKKIIDRFSGRESLTDVDKKWTRKVTDVRNWFVFSASERWREDNTEKEYYSNSAGKSGGQKEKLAYTILAAALAYQFGLHWGETQSRSFRFVMIDEAFGRGSDESARYGLELFSKLNLQLLIVTPLQKIHIIENYVKSVNFVHNEGGKNSMLRNLTLSEYQQEKSATV